MIGTLATGLTASKSLELPLLRADVTNGPARCTTVSALLRGCALVCLGSAIGLGAQTPTQQPQAGDQGEFTLKSFSRLTVVDITAIDSKENPVRGLPEGAFTVLEDGKPQPIRSFAEIGKDTPAVTRVMPKLPPNIYTNLQPAPTTSAVNVLLLDALNTAPADQVFVKDETIRYLKSMAPGTRIAVMGLGSKLRLLQGFTTDPTVLMAAINTRKSHALPSPFDLNAGDETASVIELASDDVAAAMQEFQNEQTAFQNDMRTRMTLEALNQIAAYLSGIKGRKNLIWFSSGIPLQMFPEGGRDDLSTMTDYTKDLRRTTDLLTAAQVAVYPVDATGVTTNPSASVVHPPTGFSSGRGDSMGKAIQAFDMKTGQAHLAMEAVAEATGGAAFYNTNGLKEAVQKAINNGENYYTLSYTPPDPKFDGIFHKISVRVNVPGVRLSYRKGYYSDDIAHNQMTPGLTLATTAPEPYGNNMQASMGRGVPTSSQILFTVRAEPHGDTVNPPDAKLLGTLDPKLQGKPTRRYDFQYSIPGRQFTFKDAPGGMHKGTAEFDIAAYDVYGKVLTQISQTMDLTLNEERYQLLQKKPFQLMQDIDLPLGETFVRLGVLDGVSDKTGTLEIPLEVTRKPASSQTSSLAKPQP